MKSDFWTKLDELISSSKIVIDRPKGSVHPKYSSFIYPYDYGYLENTNSSDGNEIDVWRGSKKECSLDAIICSVDLLKKDSEIKLLIGCTDDEQEQITSFINESEFMSAILIKR